MNHARNLARSGRYDGWEAIRADMQAVSDLSDAERWFSDPAFRAQLNQLCEFARQGYTGPRGPGGRRLKRV
jgi:putative SOS response-associated peptidase YedK